MKNLERENELLRRMVADLSALLHDLLLAMPKDLRELPESQRAMELSGRLMEEYIEYASQVQTSRNRQ